MRGGGFIFPQTMTPETKETIQYMSAVCMLVFGALMCAAGLLIPPMGEVHTSILAILGQCVLFAGAVFGLKAYIDTAISRHLQK